MKKITINIFNRFVIILILLGFLISIITVSANENNNSKEICVPRDYSTIQEAIDHAEDGDKVIVASGIYKEMINFISSDLADKNLRQFPFT